MTPTDWLAEWGAELYAWNVAIERCRHEYDRSHGNTDHARAWSVAQVRRMYDYARSHPEVGPRPHEPKPHRCDRIDCADWNREWWREYQRNRKRKLALLERAS